MANPRVEIRWLHLSDLHIRQSDSWAQDVVLRSLRDDIAAVCTPEWRPDFVFVTGDVAFSGDPKEYELAEKFLREILTITALPAERLLLVPGNHDIQRTVEEDAFAGARLRLAGINEVDQFLSRADRRTTLFKRQAAFRAFANRIRTRDTYTASSYCHVESFSIADCSIRVVLIDSSWLAEGGDGDGHRLVIGERQLIDSFCDTTGSLVFGLVHHPASWLAPFEHGPIPDLISKHCHMLLRGHVHEDAIETVVNSGNRLTIFTAGATFESRLSRNTYSTCGLDLLGGIGQVQCHRYNNATKSWHADQPESWRLVDRDNLEVSIEQVLDVVSELGVPHSAYFSCLIGNMVTEIPVRRGDQCVISSLHDSHISHGPLGESVLMMQHLFHWRSIWSATAWRDEAIRIAGCYVKAIEELQDITSAKDFFLQRGTQCTDLLRAVGRNSPSPGSLLNQVKHFASGGEEALASQLLRRVIGSGVLSRTELEEAHRIELQLLVREDPLKAAGHAVERLENGSRSADDYYLAALCLYNIRDYAAAAGFMNAALDLGAGGAEIKRLGNLIAGAAGDPGLSKRLNR